MEPTMSKLQEMWTEKDAEVQYALDHLAAASRHVDELKARPKICQADLDAANARIRESLAYAQSVDESITAIRDLVQLTLAR